MGKFSDMFVATKQIFLSQNMIFSRKLQHKGNVKFHQICVLHWMFIPKTYSAYWFGWGYEAQRIKRLVFLPQTWQIRHLKRLWLQVMTIFIEIPTLWSFNGYSYKPLQKLVLLWLKNVFFSVGVLGFQCDLQASVTALRECNRSNESWMRKHMENVRSVYWSLGV